VSSTVVQRKALKGGRLSGSARAWLSGSARAWLGGAGAALVLGGAIAAGAILTRGQETAVPSAPARLEATSAIIAPLADGYATERLSGYEWWDTGAPARSADLTQVGIFAGLEESETASPYERWGTPAPAAAID